MNPPKIAVLLKTLASLKRQQKQMIQEHVASQQQNQSQGDRSEEVSKLTID